ncbi:AlpA family phage regulatory protein [Pseudomonas sp. LS44]|uniref:helix-turn-helix transcriptional regulator n=1 Tax=Pseudomonas sp. LS44 TaxID=1357074 RepID=UPI00215AE96B|nr:AlpA family phage regulatory protein [Pseudomonas sp. LS44]UVE18334.1 AlpA family phage regulatory protein [Pseudomonas sp. LS44]
MTDTRSNTPDEIWRLPTVMAKTGYKRSSIYEYMARGEFPLCHRISRRSVGWSSLAVQAFIDAKLEGQE